MYFDVM